MEYYFTEEEKEQKLNVIEFEEDELLFECQKIESNNQGCIWQRYILTGIATIENERYHNFEIEIELFENIEEISAVNILASEWNWYDYIC